MIKVYVLNCRDIGADCEFVARGATIEEVVELCAEHGRAEHEMAAFGREFFVKMRRCVQAVEEESPSSGA